MRSIESIGPFFSSLYIFFLIIAGFATRLVNRVSFVRSACSFFLSFSFVHHCFASILSPRFNSESFHTNFRTVFSPLISSIYLSRNVALKTRSFKTEQFIKCLFLFLCFAARGLRRCGRFRRHDGRLWCLRWSG